MKRKNFLQNTFLTLASGTLINPVTGFSTNNIRKDKTGKDKKAKNIIFLVSDGMSTGTLNMANMLLQRKEGRTSNWIKLYEEEKVTRALMDTASASSLVTDSAAASSSWGGGVRVKNGSLNVGPNGEQYKPILQKLKAAGKSVGCVTTVPICHATPAGFCINNNKRGDMDEIALQYLPLQFDVMMGGGTDNFMAEKRKDKTDVLKLYLEAGYTVVTDKKGLMNQTEFLNAPLLGVFYDGGLPYSLDMAQDKSLQDSIPTLAEMTKKAIDKLSKNKNGFVLQVEAGKVDWSAHMNDIGALLYDQIAFDDAVKIAIDFAEKDKNTLVIITTDHGNANPGLFYGDKATKDFDTIHKFKHTNEWIFSGMNKSFTAQQVMERIEYAQGIVIKKEEAEEIVVRFQTQKEDGVYNHYKLPYKYLGEIQRNHTSVNWGSMHHSADYVELCMYGPGSELLKPFIKNTDLHYLMLQATDVSA